MNTLLTKSVAVLSLGSLIVFSGTPAVYAATVSEISGNGAGSDSAINMTNTDTKTVVQSNNATVTNDITSDANTGDNEAKDNTGGDVTIGTGNALSTVEVDTRVNLNKISDGLTSSNGSVGALIAGNGADSTSDINATDTHALSAFQDNYADVSNSIDANANTGYNDANRNTGGDVTVITGHAQTGVGVSTTANANLLNLGGQTSANGGVEDLRIIGNGALSDSSINVTRTHSLSIVQDNTAHIDNYVDANADTGYNDAKDNTGGSVRVDTGMAKALVAVDNMANFNYASDLHSVLPSIGAKVAANGAYADSNINQFNVNAFSVFQGGNEGAGNLFNLSNRINTTPDSGYNDANRNTGALVGGVFAGDPLLVTGHAQASTTVHNVGNANVFGPTGVTLPGGMNLDLQFDLGALLGLLH